jgi:hypothetical protein
MKPAIWPAAISAKLREQLAQAQTQMIIAMLLGAGAMVAGARRR